MSELENKIIQRATELLTEGKVKRVTDLRKVYDNK